MRCTELEISLLGRTGEVSVPYFDPEQLDLGMDSTIHLKNVFDNIGQVIVRLSLMFLLLKGFIPLLALFSASK